MQWIVDRRICDEAGDPYTLERFKNDDKSYFEEGKLKKRKIYKLIIITIIM